MVGRAIAFGIALLARWADYQAAWIMYHWWSYSPWHWKSKLKQCYGLADHFAVVKCSWIAQIACKI